MNFYDFAETVIKFNSSNFLNEIQSKLEKDNDAIQLQLDQYDEGLDANGKVLGYYTKATELLSGGRKEAGDKYNLLDTGDFRKNILINGFEKNNDLFVNFDSTGKNTNLLLDSIGSTIFGLQDKNKDKLTGIMREIAVTELKKSLKL